MNLKQKTIFGFKWSLYESILSQGIQFAFGIILARLLSPKDFGLIGMLTIFISISQIFVEGGFTSAVIQKKNRSDIDYSTLFLTNLFISIFFYFLIFIFSPLIASFYNTDILEIIAKIIGLNIIINSFSIVQKTILSINLDFKTQAKSSILSNLISGIISVILAFKGYGVWTLIIQTILRNIINTIFLWIFNDWQIKISFSKESFKYMIKYGHSLLSANLVYTFFENIYFLVIGKYFNSYNLGLFVKSKNLSSVIPLSLTNIIQRVSFPIMSSIQDDEDRLSSVFRKLIKTSAFISFPITILLSIISKPLILVLLTKKWENAIPIFQILCFSFLFFPINEININLLKVKARTNSILFLEIIKKTIAVLLLIIAIPFGIIPVVISYMTYSWITYLITISYSIKLTRYTFLKQLKDIFPFLLVSFIIGLLTYCMCYNISSNLLNLTLSIIIYSILYLTISFFIFNDQFLEIFHILTNKKNE
jgi:O-antigen/teichoic acid export membrane protein